MYQTWDLAFKSVEEETDKALNSGTYIWLGEAHSLAARVK